MEDGYGLIAVISQLKRNVRSEANEGEGYLLLRNTIFYGNLVWKMEAME
jgi:hypothetical protein